MEADLVAPGKLPNVILAWMACCQRYARKVLLSLDPPDAELHWRRFEDCGPEGGSMTPLGCPFFQSGRGSPDDLLRVADQLDLCQAERTSDFDGLNQRQPLGIFVAAISEIIKPVGHAPHHHGHFDPAGIGTASAIEKDLDALAVHRATLQQLHGLAQPRWPLPLAGSGCERWQLSGISWQQLDGRYVGDGRRDGR